MNPYQDLLLLASSDNSSDLFPDNNSSKFIQHLPTILHTTKKEIAVKNIFADWNKSYVENYEADFNSEDIFLKLQFGSILDDIRIRFEKSFLLPSEFVKKVDDVIKKLETDFPFLQDLVKIKYLENDDKISIELQSGEMELETAQLVDDRPSKRQKLDSGEMYTTIKKTVQIKPVLIMNNELFTLLKLKSLKNQEQSSIDRKQLTVDNSPIVSEKELKWTKSPTFIKIGCDLISTPACEPNSAENNTIVLQTLRNVFPFQLYAAINKDRISNIRLSVMNEKNKPIKFKDDSKVKIFLHIRPMTERTFILRTNSTNDENGLYKERNTPFRHVNKLTTILTENKDLCKWKIALINCCFPAVLLKKNTDNNQLKIGCNLITEQIYENSLEKYMAIANLTSSDREKTSYYSYSTKNPVFLPIWNNNLTEIETNLWWDKSNEVHELTAAEKRLPCYTTYLLKMI